MAPNVPRDERVITAADEAAYAAALARGGFFGPDSWYMNADANRALSQRRAIAIRDYLLESLPISADRLEATGYGEDRPIATNETEEGRTRNRRIEIVLALEPR